MQRGRGIGRPGGELGEAIQVQVWNQKLYNSLRCNKLFLESGINIMCKAFSNIFTISHPNTEVCRSHTGTPRSPQCVTYIQFPWGASHGMQVYYGACTHCIYQLPHRFPFIQVGLLEISDIDLYNFSTKTQSAMWWFYVYIQRN